MRCEARHSPEAEHTVWWLLLCRAVERAARAEAFREWFAKMPSLELAEPDQGEPYAAGYYRGQVAMFDALRARGEGGEG